MMMFILDSDLFFLGFSFFGKISFCFAILSYFGIFAQVISFQARFGNISIEMILLVFKYDLPDQ